ncbi:FAD-dependent oxidoreductase, partial [Nostoc sp. UCD120]|uniref:FAD-dependent oxidoreductase n=1 Tax=Nostoc sp. UCD120 TaxID=2681312 RepID=UPI001625B460
MPRSFYARLSRRFATEKSGYDQREQRKQRLDELLEYLPILSYVDRPSHEQAKKVAVIGAGLAGLSAAYILKKAGLNVQVFEASERIGGRVSSSNIKISTIKENLFSDKVIEFGAELIGANHLLWLFFARKFNLGLNLLTDEGKFDLEGLEEPA